MKTYQPIRKIIITFLLFSLSFAQTISIQGKVFTQNHEPISGVNIYTENIGTSSQYDGSFSLNVDANEMVTFSHVGFSDVSMLASEIGDIIQLNTIELSVPPIIVKGGLRSTSLLNSASSISIIGESTLKKESSPHFQGLIQTIPNLNWAGGTSRPRYFQIRGIGERSQYVGEGTPNFSVGFMVDGIDFSGIGMAGMLFDAQQIEIFKGPQSSIYGSNAMAGLINISTSNPTFEKTGHTMIRVGSDTQKTFGLAIGAPLSSRVAYRLALQKHTQDGFRSNRYSNITDSNKRDELYYRAKLSWLITNDVNIQLLHFNANLNNGYDAWAVDNNKDFITYSDSLGIDSQSSTANSIKINFTKLSGINGSYQFSKSKNKMEHSYDGDWANELILENEYNWYPGNQAFNDSENYAWGYYPWVFYDKTIRIRNTDTHELRLTSNNKATFSWVVGFFTSKSNENDDASGYLFGGDADLLNSKFLVNNNSLYAQISKKINNFNFTLNLRNENQYTKYTSNGESWGYAINPVSTDVEHSFSGGKLAINYILNNVMNIFTSISKGYKAGGINQHPSLSELGRFYEPEYNVNFEAGIKFHSDNIISNITLFSMDRTNQQVQISSQQEVGNSSSFHYFTSNATTGKNTGLEFDAKFKFIDGFTAKTSLGLLNTSIDSYDFWKNDTTLITLGNREQAMSPSYNFSFALNYSHGRGLFSEIELTGKNEYYYSDSHNEKSDAYQLLNLTTGYSKESWTISLWGKNIADTRYATRGFYFNNEPIWNEALGYHEYPKKLYVSYGDPKEYGLSLQYSF
ncbi:MAG: TonB-dependent receptor [Candidatus Marinimicrobia bacterium]|nr:TonB-dependent receptor [Candidatus Neomarinimicrobiota bacterium]